MRLRHHGPFFGNEEPGDGSPIDAHQKWHVSRLSALLPLRQQRAQIGWALDDLPEPIRNLPGKVVDVASDLIDLVGEGIDLVGASEVLVCLTALTTCLTLVCEGLRAADSNFGGRIALGGVAGAVGTLWCRYDRCPD